MKVLLHGLRLNYLSAWVRDLHVVWGLVPVLLSMVYNLHLRLLHCLVFIEVNASPTWLNSVSVIIYSRIASIVVDS